MLSLIIYSCGSPIAADAAGMSKADVIRHADFCAGAHCSPPAWSAIAPSRICAATTMEHEHAWFLCSAGRLERLCSSGTGPRVRLNLWKQKGPCATAHGT